MPFIISSYLQYYYLHVIHIYKTWQQLKAKIYKYKNIYKDSKILMFNLMNAYTTANFRISLQTMQVDVEFRTRVVLIILGKKEKLLRGKKELYET